jgi:hypothetical protein
MTTERIQHLLDVFDHFDDTYKRAELEEALTLREEITPHLLAILERLIADPDLYIAEAHYGNVYASALLSHFREPRAHQLLIRAFALSRDRLDPLWGDIVTETFPAMLLNTCAGSMAGIQALVLDRQVDEYVRSSALSAIAFAVVANVISRREALDFFATLFDRSLAEEDSYFWLALASSIEDLEGVELANEVRALVADELAPEGEIAEWLLEEPQLDLFADEPEVTLTTLKEEMAYRVPENIHGYCSWFGCFQENRPVRHFHDHDGPFPPGASLPKTNPKQKNKARKNRKLAKKSKRKNRK